MGNIGPMPTHISMYTSMGHT